MLQFIAGMIVGGGVGFMITVLMLVCREGDK
jgi:hypothetical protein